jgi:hypothetical protein
VDAVPTGRLAEDRDVARITAELGDVALDPAKRRLLVQEAVVAGGVVGRLFGQCPVGQESEPSKPVVDRDDDAALLNQPRRVVVVALAGGQRAAVDPEHDRQVLRVPLPVAAIGRIDVQVQAVLVRRRPADRGSLLRAVVREVSGVERSVPARVRPRRAPAQVADRRRRVRDA